MRGLQAKLTQNEKEYDLLLDIRKDMRGCITQGLCTAETTPQNQTFLLVAKKGELKENPTVGVGIEDIINDHQFEQWKRHITIEFERDGQYIDTLELDGNGLTLNAKYK